jgi:hypothetical protein
MDLGGNDLEPHTELFTGQPGLLVRLPEGSLLGRLMTVEGTAGQSPGVAMVAPLRAMLQQYSQSAVPEWGT